MPASSTTSPRSAYPKPIAPGSSARQSHSPVTARSPESSYRRYSSSRLSDAREEDPAPGTAGWPGRLGASYNKMGFGSSNERGGDEDEAIDSASDREGGASRKPTPEKRSTPRPILKIEEASPVKRPRRELTLVLVLTLIFLLTSQTTIYQHLVPAQETDDVMEPEGKQAVKDARHSTTTWRTSRIR